MPKNDDITPIRKQYLEIKRQYPETIVFFRLGDFYETFDQDAEVAARELDIVLTSRNVAKGMRVPMAGIPYHAVENYLARLIERGYHVAICEQVGDQPTKGLFPRKVVRVVTPGTIVEPGLLPSDANNYLVSVFILDDRAGIAYADITTGEFAATELVGGDIHSLVRAELSRLHPAEILHPEGLEMGEGTPGHRTSWPAWHFEPGRSREALLSHFGVSLLDGFGLRDLPLAVRVAGAIIQYLELTQPSALNLLARLSTYHLSEFMTIDAPTRRNLELLETIRSASIRGSLLGELDRTVTPMGRRLIRQWVNKPLLDVRCIRQRQDGVAYFFDHGLTRIEIRSALKKLGDLERLVSRVIGGTAQPRDLVGIRDTLEHLPAISRLLDREEAALSVMLADFNLCVDELSLLQAAPRVNRQQP
jgi:DNA mismatch repair protein MutS